MSRVVLTPGAMYISLRRIVNDMITSKDSDIAESFDVIRGDRADG